MNKILPLVVIIIFSIRLQGQEGDLILPSRMPRETIINHKAYTFSYNSSYALPSWVAYKITKSQVNKDANVKQKYKEDPLVTIRAANTKDYKDGGYLMAQLVSYLDVMQNGDAVEETFYMTNIVPMKLAFYTHIWLKTDDLIRKWVANGDGFYVYTGPVIKADAPFPTMGKNKISIPNRYYKIVYDPQNKQAVAFLFRNGSSSGTLKSYSTTVDEIEELTGVDFLPELSKEESREIESKVDYSFWNFELEEDL